MKKKPQVGQWWVNPTGTQKIVHKTGIVLFVGRDSKRRLLWEDCQGHIETDYNLDWSGWHHEPACTGWDWVPEGKEEFPQWYSYKDGPFEINNDPYLIRVDSDVEQSFVHRSGKIDRVTYPYKLRELKNNVSSGAWKKLTQQEADEILYPNPAVESPDDWVTQDRVVERIGVDQWRFSDGVSHSSWVTSGEQQSSYGKHGDRPTGGSQLEVRCRRKDLPVVEAKRPLPCSYCSKPEFKGWNSGKCPYCGKRKPETATVTVYEVVYGDRIEAMVYGRLVGDDDLAELRSGWKYVSVVSTKTVEVML